MTFKPLPSPDRWHGVAAVLVLLGLDMLIVRFVLARPVDGASFLLSIWVLASFLVVAYVGFRTIGNFTLQYWVDRDAVTLIWGPTRQVVPMGQIERIVRDLADMPHDPARPWHWPCPHRRRFSCGRLGMINAYANRPLTEQIILVTAEESYGISPADPDGFIAALQERYQLGTARPLKAELQRSPLWTWRLWRDRSALLLIGAGLLGVLVMFGLFSFRLPSLSSDLPLHFDVNGLPDRIAPKSGLIALPAIGFLTWVANLIGGILIYRRIQRQGAYLLWGGAIAVQVIATLALLNIMRW